MKRKRILGILMSILMIITMIPSFTFAADLPFTDVSTSAWYYSDVKTAYDTGLINGMDATTFAPESNLTYAQAVKLAACMNQKYSTGSVTLANESPNWWDSYVEYAKEKNIINKDYYWNSNATRAGYVEIFAKALPDEALKSKNTVVDGAIPDVDMSHPQASAIYKLYRAGILTGNDEKGTFLPNNPIKRSEVSAILTRMMNESARKDLDLSSVTPPDDSEVQGGTITDSWSEIIASVNNGTYKNKYKIGDTKALDLGSEGVVEMQIAAFGADELADGSGNKAAITWISKQLLKTDHRMNPDTESIVDWDHSELRALLQSEIKPLIPDVVRSAIRPVKKYSSSDVTENALSIDDLWIPSVREMTGLVDNGMYGEYLEYLVNYESEGPEYTEFFHSENDLIKQKSGESSDYEWWLRSASGISFCYVDSSGSICACSAYSNNGVALGFCV